MSEGTIMREQTVEPPSIRKDRRTVSIVVVTYNSFDYVRTCFRSIEQYGEPYLVETWMVDNASDPAALEKVTSEFPQVRLIANDRNLGFAKACNQGLAASAGEFLLVLNPDAVLLPGSLERMIRHMDDGEDIGIIGPKVYDDMEKTRIQLSCRSFPSYAAGIFNRQSLFTRLFPANRYSNRYLLSAWRHDECQNVDWVSGCCMLLRRTMTTQIGFFDDSFFFTCEDVDLCLRALQHGWKTCYCAEAEVVHFGGGGAVSKQMPIKSVIVRHTSIWQYYRKHMNHGAILSSFTFIGICVRATSLICKQLLLRVLSIFRLRLSA